VTLVVAGIIVRACSVLVGRRSARKSHAGKWEFPGGKVEAGEMPREALRRELREELSIDADVGEEVWRTNYRYPGRAPLELVFFPVPSFRGEIGDHGHFADVRWQPIDRLAELDFLEADRDLVAALVAGRIPAVRGGAS